MPKISLMLSFRSTPFRDRGMIALLLAVFLFGSNYCVLAAAASDTPAASRLACHAIAAAPGSTADHNRPAAPSEAPRASYPCCIQVAPASVLGVDDRVAATASTLAAAVETGLLPPSHTWFPHVESAGESPPNPPPALLRGRAPPIAS